MQTNVEVNGVDYYEAGFFGDCFGVVLTKRALDKAVEFQIVSEDDGNWFKDEKGDGNAYWLPDLLAQLIHAKDWCDANTIRTPYGYTFKD